MANKRYITNFDEAFKLGLNYIDNPREMNAKKMFEYPAPEHATSSRWLINEETLRHTLEYIFNGLAHNCYMLCIGKDNKKVFYKLDCLETPMPERFEAALNQNLQKLSSNKLITGDQRDIIRKRAKPPVRIMQCIVKPRNKEKGDGDGEELENTNEYIELLADLSLPPGVFILNLTDAVILRRDNHEPFPMVTGDKMLPAEFCHRHHLPIMSLSGEKKYSDIPFPNYDDLFIVLGKKDMKFGENIVNWDDKQIHKAVFRGGPSGCGYTAKTNQRIKLVGMQSPLLDVKIVGKGKTIDSNSIKFDPVYGLGMLNTGLKPGGFKTMAEQSNYKYIIHIDGNVHAYRLLSTMMTGSLILRVESPYVSWVDHLIESGKHYLMVKSDLSDLLKIIKWCEKHPEKAREIAEAGREFAQMALTREFVAKSVEKIFWSLPFMSDKSRIKTEKHLKMAVHNKTRKRSKKRVIKEESVKEAKEEKEASVKEESVKEESVKEEKEEKEVKPEPTGAQKKPRCPNGQRRNKKTGECEPSK